MILWAKPYTMNKQIQSLIFWAIYRMGPSFSVHTQLWMPWGGKLDVEGFALIGLLVISRTASMKTETTCQGQIHILHIAQLRFLYKHRFLLRKPTHEIIDLKFLQMYNPDFSPWPWSTRRIWYIPQHRNALNLNHNSTFKACPWCKKKFKKSNYNIAILDTAKDFDKVKPGIIGLL